MEKVPEITKVIGVSKLSAKYKSFEAKRVLCASYDFFVADSRILPTLPKKLGKTFFMKKKQPISVELNSDPKALLGESGGLKSVKNLNLAIHGQTHMFPTLGTCLSIRIGHTGMSGKEVMENILEAMPKIALKIPGQWENIQSLSLKTNDSIALPIYNSAVELLMEVAPSN